MYVLPKGYTGWVLIIFNQPNGQRTKYENGKRVYEIPEDGILRTQFAPNRDWHLPNKFFYTENGKMIEIPEFDYKDLKIDSIQACCLSSGKTAKTPNDNWIEFDDFYVGTKTQIDEASKKANKTKIADLIAR
jgi:hypothetical protein